LELFDEILQRRGPDGSLFFEVCDALLVEIENHAAMAGAKEPTAQVGAHSSQSYHCDLHNLSPNARERAFGAFDVGIARRVAGRKSEGEAGRRGEARLQKELLGRRVIFLACRNLCVLNRNV
jgi:hypothetical protein